jgi:sodium/proline symporter
VGRDWGIAVRAMTRNTLILAELALYLLGMLLIGIYVGRKKLSQEQYHLGGRSLAGWALALSERSTGESAWLILGLTGAAFATGLPELWVAVGCVCGIIASWLLLARRFRAESARYGVITFIDYFAAKFPGRARSIRWVAAITIVFFYVVYVYAQFEGTGKVLNETFGLDPTIGIVVSALVTIAYSTAGGFVAVVWTDVVQALLMILTFIVTPVMALAAVLGQGLSISGALAAAGPGAGSLWGGKSGGAAVLLALAGFSWFFGYLGGQPQLSTRWMAMRNDRDVKRGAWIAIVWTLLAYVGAITIGLCALALYGKAAVADPEHILPYMLGKLVPPWLGGLLLVGAIAAIMSTASSLLLIVCSTVTEDIVHKTLRLDLGERKLLLISRLTLLVCGALALGLALTLGKPVFSVVSWVWAGIGCSFSPAVILAFYWKRCSGAGILGSLLCGFATTVVWMTSSAGEWLARAVLGAEGKLPVMVSSFVVALGAAIVCSLLFPDRPEPTAEGVPVASAS